MSYGPTLSSDDILLNGEEMVRCWRCTLLLSVTRAHLVEVDAHGFDVYVCSPCYEALHNEGVEA